MTELPTGNVTLLFSDIEGSTALLKRLEDGWPGVLERQRAVLRDAVAGAGGVVVDCQGDAMFAAFGSARSGVDAAIEVQNGLAQEQWPDGAAVRVRMALHTGEPQLATTAPATSASTSSVPPGCAPPATAGRCC